MSLRYNRSHETQDPLAPERGPAGPEGRAMPALRGEENDSLNAPARPTAGDPPAHLGLHCLSDDRGTPGSRVASRRGTSARGLFTSTHSASYAPPHPIPLPRSPAEGGEGIEMARNGSLSLGEGEGRGEGARVFHA